MKFLQLISLICLAACLYSLSACQQFPRAMAQDSQDKARAFPSAEEAAKQAQADLAEVLSQAPDLNMGLKPEVVRSADQGAVIPVYQVDFTQLLQADSSSTLDQISQEEDQVIVPLQRGRQVITVVQVAKQGQGWDITGLGEATTAAELAAIPPASRQTGLRQFIIPNLQMSIYASDTPNGVLYFSSLSRREPFGRGMKASEVMRALLPAARQFERSYGALLRKDPQGLVR